MFRTLGTSKIAFILAILFGISLFFFRGGSRYSNLLNSDSIVAKVSGTPISTNKFNRTMEMNIDNFNQMLGKQLTGDEIRSFQIHSLALGALINEAMFENEYNQLNFKIDEKLIASKTRDRIPQLYNKNNQLNENYLKTFLQQQRLKIEDIVQIIDFETRDKYFNDAFFNLNFPSYFANKITNYESQIRNISYIELSLDKINIDEIKKQYSSNMESELKKFYDKNLNNYLTSEKRDIEYIKLNKKNMYNNFTPSTFEVEEYYKNNKNLYFSEEARSFIQFNFKTLEEAKIFKEKIKAFNISEVINFSNENNITFNEFENLESNEMLEQISNKLFNLKINEQSNIIETTLAKHIIFLKSIKPAYQKKLQEVSDEIKNSITEIEADNFFNDLADNITEKIINGNSLKEISQNINIEIKFIDKLSRNLNENTNIDADIIGSLINSSFVSNKDFVSDIINVDNNISYIFNVKNIYPSTPLKFNNIKDILLNDWEISKKIEKIIQKTNENISNKLFLKNLSDEYFLDVEEVKIKKDTTKLPRNFLNMIFQAELNQNIQNFNEDKFLIAHINKIIISDKNVQYIAMPINNDLKATFGQELMKEKKISTNDSLISALIEQF